MNNDYKAFFKAAKQSREAIASPTRDQTRASAQGATASSLKKEKSSPPVVTTKKKSYFPPLSSTLGLSLICLGLGFAYAQPEFVYQWLSKIEILPMSVSSASTTTSGRAAANLSPSLGGEEAKSSLPGEGVAPTVCLDPKAMSEEDLSHFKSLGERKIQLDQREKQLLALEEELQRQKQEVEERIAKLESIRTDIAGVLKERVDLDQERVQTLVEFYSNMKPKQAADIFSNLNEDLTVEVLTKMKKKNAAEIMNLLPPEKAKIISEKFTGYKRR